jgi:hypothetical protein
MAVYYEGGQGYPWTVAPRSQSVMYTAFLLAVPVGDVTYKGSEKKGEEASSIAVCRRMCSTHHQCVLYGLLIFL